MEKQAIKVSITQGYGGSVKSQVKINNISYVLDLDWLEERIKKDIIEKGYTTRKSSRQKYPRIIIND